MTTITNLIPSLVALKGFDANYFKHRLKTGDLVFVQRTTKRYYITHSINAANYLLACNRVLHGAPSNFSADFSAMIEDSHANDWLVYYRSDRFKQMELDALHRFYSDHQRVLKRSTRKNNQQKTTWVYLLSHKASGRRFHLLADEPMNQVQAVGMFMRRWKQNNTDCLDRKMIPLGSYYESMHHFQEATRAIQKHDYLQFEFATVTSLQNVTREVARHTTTNTNRVDTIKYFQNIYKQLKQHGGTMVSKARTVNSHDPSAY